jgi:hypothetical protein
VRRGLGLLGLLYLASGGAYAQTTYRGDTIPPVVEPNIYCDIPPELGGG